MFGSDFATLYRLSLGRLFVDTLDRRRYASGGDALSPRQVPLGPSAYTLSSLEPRMGTHRLFVLQTGTFVLVEVCLYMRCPLPFSWFLQVGRRSIPIPCVHAASGTLCGLLGQACIFIIHSPWIRAEPAAERICHYVALKSNYATINRMISGLACKHSDVQYPSRASLCLADRSRRSTCTLPLETD